MEIEKSKINHIESLTETLRQHFGKLDPLLNTELEKLVGLIREEKERDKKLAEIAQLVANRI